MCSASEIAALSASVLHITVRNNCSNDVGFTELNLNRFIRLRGLVIGDDSFTNVGELVMVGFVNLRSVVVGFNSFSKSSTDDDANRRFVLKNCPKLKSLKIGRYSFSDYSVIEIENVDALEVIEMGDLSDKECNSFRDASLTLRDLPALKTLVFGRGAFSNCLQAVFENLPELESIRMGYSAFAFGYENTTKLVMKSCAFSVR